MGFPQSPVLGETYTTPNGTVYIYEGSSTNKWRLQAVSPTLKWQEAVLSIETSPPFPVDGNRYLVGSSPSGDFSGHANHIAEGNGTGWDFEVPSDQWAVFNAGTSEGYVFYGGAWHLLYDVSTWIDHGHSADDITSGTLDKARLGAGTGGQGDILAINSNGDPEWVTPLLYTAADGSTITFDMNNSRHQLVTLGGNRNLAVSNVVTGSTFIIHLKQDATGNRTVTWWSGISWAEGGTPPTLTSGANKTDSFRLICTSASNYMGYVMGQNI
jgi:hypothetical protein